MNHFWSLLRPHLRASDPPPYHPAKFSELFFFLTASTTLSVLSVFLFVFYATRVYRVVGLGDIPF